VRLMYYVIQRRASLAGTATAAPTTSVAASAAAPSAVMSSTTSMASESRSSDVCAPSVSETSASSSGSTSGEELLQQGRYVAYARRAVQALLTKGRAIAYTSDIGESVRPVVPPAIVKACYGATWAYVATDVAYNTSEEYAAGGTRESIMRVAAHSTIFQCVASVAVPSLIIHQVVHAVQHQARRLPAGRLRFWLPSLCGLACIPLMPYVDEPCEHAIDAAFEKAWPSIGTSARRSKAHHGQQTDSSEHNGKVE
jgi:fission process protein 1